MGSCFSDEMSKRLASNKFTQMANPFGTIYNPISIFKLLSGDVDSGQTIESHSVFYHWDAHGSISGLTSKETQSLFQNCQTKTQGFLSKTNWLIITLGTSYVYEYQRVGIVSNCHKVPASNFTKRLLTQAEIIDSFEKAYSGLVRKNPGLNVVFTVSPVRHVRDGIVENNRSKAILIDAIHQLTECFENVSYFPSYEIVVDELRDYRFYQKDMIHPTSEASDYVWDQFVNTYFDASTKKTLFEWKKLMNAINHKPFQPESEAHQQFLKSTYSALEKMNEKMDVRVELEQLKKQIK